MFVSSCNSTDGQEPEANEPSIEPDDPSVQPFCLEEEERPTGMPSSPTQPDQSESSESGAAHKGHECETRNLIELETTEDSNNKTHEVKTTSHTITLVSSPLMCLPHLGQKEQGFFFF